MRHGFDSRHMKSGMYTEGTGQQKTNSRGTNDLGDGKRADKPGGKFAGLHPEGQIPGGQPYLLPETIPGSQGPVAVRLLSIPGDGLEGPTGLSSRYDDSGGQTSGLKVCRPLPLAQGRVGADHPGNAQRARDLWQRKEG